MQPTRVSRSRYLQFGSPRRLEETGCSQTLSRPGFPAAVAEGEKRHPDHSPKLRQERHEYRNATPMNSPSSVRCGRSSTLNYPKRLIVVRNRHLPLYR
jgi:hypothetical protein